MVFVVECLLVNFLLALLVEVSGSLGFTPLVLALEYLVAVGFNCLVLTVLLHRTNRSLDIPVRLAELIQVLVVLLVLIVQKPLVRAFLVDVALLV